jgi:putative protein kinase ArgK-like GTPase of G3E family
VQEWLTHVKNRGVLVEEIYKRPGWAAALGITDAQGFHRADSSEELRRKLKTMTRAELATILIYLDSQSTGGGVML